MNEGNNKRHDPKAKPFPAKTLFRCFMRAALCGGLFALALDFLQGCGKGLNHFQLGVVAFVAEVELRWGVVADGDDGDAVEEGFVGVFDRGDVGQADESFCRMWRWVSSKLLERIMILG